MVTKFPGMTISVDGMLGGNIVVDLSKVMGETSTGKSHIVANTSGWKPFSTPEGTYKINCLIIRMK